MRSLLNGLRTGPRGRKGRRIGSLATYLKRLAGSLGEARMAKHLQVSAADLRQAIKGGRNTLTWFDPDTAAPVATVRGADGAGVKVTGVLLDGKADDYKLSAGSILDFDCVITTARRDRDGDVLDPKGAIVDPKMPLLWQHVPYQPIGRIVRLIDQTEEKVTGRFAVLDTVLGRDAATLIEGGALRISHGFSPIEYNPLKDDNGKDLGGWRISKYAMMEASVVSIPSNVDAEIEAWSRGKLHHPLVKGMCKRLAARRPKMLSLAGVKCGKPGPGGNKLEGVLKAAGDGLNLTVNLVGFAPPAAKADGYGGGDDGDADDDEKAGDPVACDACGAENPAKASACKECGAALGKAEGGDEDEDEETPDDPDPETDADDDDAEDSELEEAEDKDDEGDGGKGDAKAALLGDLITTVDELAGDKTLPKEAGNRLNTVAGILEDIDDAIGAQADAISVAAKSRDLAGMFAAVSDLVQGSMGKLASAAEELDRIAGVADLPDGVADKIRGVGESAANIVSALSTMAGVAQQASEETAGDDADDEMDAEADDEEMRNDDADEDAEDEADEEKGETCPACGGTGTDPDDEDQLCAPCRGTGERQGKADDDEDAEEKGEGEDDEEQAANPDVDEDPEAENPEVGKAARGRKLLARVLGLSLTGRGGRARRLAARLMGLAMVGKAALSPRERRQLSEVIGAEGGTRRGTGAAGRSGRKAR